MKSSLLAILILIGTAFDARSQPALTLDACLTMARERSPRLRIARNSIRSTELSQDELALSRLPQLRVAGSSIYAPSSHQFGYDPVVTDRGLVAAQLIVQQSLYDGGIRSLRSDQIQVDLERQAKEYKIADRDLAFSVKQAFIEVLRSEREAGLQDEGVRQLTEYLTVVKQLAKAGSGGTTDVLKTEVQLSNAQISRQRAVETAGVAKYSLAELIGTTIDTSFAVAGSFDDSSFQAFLDAELAPAADSLSNLELSIASLAVQHHDLEVELMQHELYPTISLMGDAGLVSSGENLRLPAADRESYVGYSLGVVLEFPLLNWGATDLRVQQRRFSADNMRLESELLRRSLTSETKKIRMQLLNLRGRIETIRANRKSAEDIFLLTKATYIGGGMLSIEVLTAQQLLTDTRLAELQSMAEIQILMARYEQLITP